MIGAVARRHGARGSHLAASSSSSLSQCCGDVGGTFRQRPDGRTSSASLAGSPIFAFFASFLLDRRRAADGYVSRKGEPAGGRERGSWPKLGLFPFEAAPFEHGNESPLAEDGTPK